MECSICFESANASTGFTQLACSHTFHLKCIVTWLSKTSSCPCCRTEPNENESVRMHEDSGAINRVLNALAKAEDEQRRLSAALRIMRKEKDRLEQIVGDGMTGKEKELLLFSKVLQRLQPSLFKIVYADNGGGHICFPAFLPQRLQQTEFAIEPTGRWGAHYEAFKSGVLAEIKRAAGHAATAARWRLHVRASLRVMAEAAAAAAIKRNN